MGSSILFLTSSTIVPLHFTTRKYLALSVVYSGYNIGALVTPYMMKTALQDLGFKYTCLIIASLTFLAAVAGTLFFPARNEAEEIHISPEEDGGAQCAGVENGVTPTANGTVNGATAKIDRTEIGEIGISTVNGSSKGVSSKGCSNFGFDSEEDSKCEIGFALQRTKIAETDISLSEPSCNCNRNLANKGTSVDVHGSVDKKNLKGSEIHQENSSQPDQALATKTKCLHFFKSLYVFRNPIFLAIAFALFGHGIGRSIVSGFEVALTTEIGIAADDIALMLSIIAASGVITGPILGAVFSISALKPYVKYLYAGACLMNGTLTLLYGVIDSFAGLLTMGIIKRAMKNVIGFQISGVLADLFGVETLLDYRATASVFEGCANVAGPFIAGKEMRAK